jgi:competence protein ComEA
MKKKYIITALTCLLLLVSGICYSCSYNNKSAAVLVSEQENQDPQFLASQAQDQGETEAVTAGTQAQPAAEQSIYVHICGAVVNPGVYQVPEGSRLVDLIEQSGGLTGEAAGDYINQAVMLEDGQRIYIPTVEEVADLSSIEYIQGSGGDQSNPEAAAASAVNINTANAEELMSLPGIGEAKANSIVSYRNKNGKFKTIEDLVNIPGIKEGLFNQISSLIVAK